MENKKKADTRGKLSTWCDRIDAAKLKGENKDRNKGEETWDVRTTTEFHPRYLHHSQDPTREDN